MLKTAVAEKTIILEAVLCLLSGYIRKIWPFHLYVPFNRFVNVTFKPVCESEF